MLDMAERLFELLRSSRGVEELGGALKIPSDIEVEVYINTGTSFLPVPKVLEIRVDRGIWALRDHKGDVSYFAAERISGLKINDSEKRKKEERGGTGFTRGL